MRLEASINLPFSCHAVEFSPFDGERVAVATAQYFGIVGNGRLHVFGRHAGDVTNSSPALQQRELRSFHTQAGLFDCAWSECHPHQMATAGADGVVKLWDLGAVDGFPVADWREHTQEVSGVDWNLVSKDLFASASWDGSVKLWTPSAGVSSHTFRDHGRHPVYGAIWSPVNPGQLLSFSGDGTARVLDINSPGAVTVLDGHGGAEVLAGDWDKYNHPVVATGCADRAVRTWDLRQPRQPLSVMLEHRYAVKRLRFSPHQSGVLATASYDTSVILWDTKITPPPEGTGVFPLAGEGMGGAGHGQGSPRLLDRCVGHTEFVAGVAFSLFEPRLMATCAWDRRLCLWRSL